MTDPTPPMRAQGLLDGLRALAAEYGALGVLSVAIELWPLAAGNARVRDRLASAAPVDHLPLLAVVDQHDSPVRDSAGGVWLTTSRAQAERRADTVGTEPWAPIPPEPLAWRVVTVGGPAPTPATPATPAATLCKAVLPSTSPRAISLVCERTHPHPDAWHREDGRTWLDSAQGAQPDPRALYLRASDPVPEHVRTEPGIVMYAVRDDATAAHVCGAYIVAEGGRCTERYGHTGEHHRGPGLLAHGQAHGAQPATHRARCGEPIPTGNNAGTMVCGERPGHDGPHLPA